MASKHEGWVKLHRKSLDSTVFEDPNVWFVWSWCLMKANHEKIKFQWNGKDMELKPGQFITGQNSALAQLNPKKKVYGITAQKLRTCLNYLKSTSRITSQSTNRFSIITIEKWKDYQDKSTSKTTRKVKSQQQTSNNKQEGSKNVKEVQEGIFFENNKNAPRGVQFFYQGNLMRWKDAEKKWFVIENGQWNKWEGKNEDEKKIVAVIK